MAHEKEKQWRRLASTSGSASVSRPRADLDYEHVEGSITFEDGECQKAIEVRLNPTRTAHRSFVVFLKPDPQQLTLAGEPYVARRRSMCTVTIVENEDVGKVCTRGAGLCTRCVTALCCALARRW